MECDTIAAVGAAVGDGAGAAAAAAADADADVRAGAGNTAGAGVQAKNGDNTKAAATATVPERTERGGRERTSTMAAGEEGGYHSGYFLSQRT